MATELNTNMTTGFKSIEIKYLREGHNARTSFDAGEIALLAESIKAQGVLEPLIVREGEKEGRYEIVAGARRFRAAKKAGLKEVPCTVFAWESPMTRDLAALAENSQRVDLTPVEFGRDCVRIKEAYKTSAKTIAQNIGKSDRYVANCMRIVQKVDAAILAECEKLGVQNGPPFAVLIACAAKKTPEDQAATFEAWRGKASEAKGEKAPKDPSEAPKRAPRGEMLALLERLRDRSDADSALVKAVIATVEYCAGERATPPRIGPQGKRK